MLLVSKPVCRGRNRKCLSSVTRIGLILGIRCKVQDDIKVDVDYSLLRPKSK